MRKPNAALAATCLVAGFLSLSTPAEASATCAGRRATKVGTANSDEIRGTKGRDVIVGRGGADLIFGLGGDDIICGSGGGDSLIGAGGNDRIYGQRGSDILYGDAGDDLLVSGDGNFEGLIGGAGNDSLDGGRGYLDFVAFPTSAAGVTVDLAAGTAGGEGTDTIVNIEGVFGSPHDDTISGSSVPNYMTGEDGNDTITGGGGGNFVFPDVYFGDAGEDTFTGTTEGVDAAIYSNSTTGAVVDLAAGTATSSEGNDTLNQIDSVEGSDFDDMLTGDATNNLLVGGAGDDQIVGGDGLDAAIFFGPTPVSVDLTAGTSTGQGSDSLSGMEDVFGTDAGDTIRGDQAGNYLDGGLGDDQIFGLAGDDLLVGGPGSDAVDGGDGGDTCLEGETLTSCESTTPPAGFRTQAADNFAGWMSDLT